MRSVKPSVWASRSIINIVFEENSKVKEADIKKAVNDIYESLKAAKNRCPIMLESTVGKKSDHQCFAIPDFLLAIFAKYATLNSTDEKGDRKQLFFERLRDKYRVILDADADIVFSRKRPFVAWN